MKKSVCLLMFILLLLSVPVYSASASVYEDEYEPNDSLASAYDIGLWKYKTISATIHSAKDKDFYKFYATKGEQLAIHLKNIPAGTDYDLFLFKDSYGYPAIDASERTGTQNEIIRFDVPETGKYIAVVSSKNGTYDEWGFYRLEFIDRMKSGTYTARLSPSAISSPGKGTVSPTAAVNLANDSAVPDGAVVKSVSAEGTISPSLGNTFREVLNKEEGVWHKTVSGGTLFPDIKLENGLPVKTTWNARYYSLAWSSSTWKSPQLKINYQYDQTYGW
ncbi:MULTISPECIES: PPC domain-containing protein [Bacillus]|uniref:Anti protein n=1 Tax=Bacillus glycinifermentans TaxID=1664069 RepID=A0AAJ3YXJ7_9BACI|nr:MULTISPECIES: PPC domain-containing protein [Bacillus]KKB75470.1 anti protein [Bacillus sp. TH008]MDU0071157.1 PPC domain-containing protein [Bacillus sp. IG6]MED8019025.1 PPC domain-containing protein [Bacillus glycinifermentans]QAT63785.1 anti protein [Bacillus glycinifermentans]WKB77659.1 PPC domain-containing protein [Bacillus glycinifermentans]